MFFKLGVRSLLRQIGKTLAFFLLLFFVNLFLVLSVSMKVSCTDLLSEADNSFLSIADLDFRGGNYPTENSHDADLMSCAEAQDYEYLSNLPGVKHFEPYVRIRGYAGEYPALVDKHYTDMSVILFKVIGETPYGDISCMLLKNYSTHNYLVEGGYFTLEYGSFTKNGKPLDILKYLKPEHRYIATGEYVSINGTSTFSPAPFVTNQISLTDEQVSILLSSPKSKDVRKFFLTPDILEHEGAYSDFLNEAAEFYETIFDQKFIKNGFYIDVTKNPNVYGDCVYDEDWTASQPELWEKFANDPESVDMDWKNVLYAVSRSYDIMANTLDVVMTDNSEYQRVFHQNTVPLEDGDYYTESDGKNVCLISSVMAYTMKLEVGDSIHLDLHNAATGDDYYNSYFYGAGFKHSGDYVIKGIYKLTEEITDTIFIPVQTFHSEKLSLLFTETGISRSCGSYKLGTFVLENKTAKEFSSLVKGKLYDKCAVTVYDQGYINVAAPLESMHDTSLLLIGICSFTGLSIILLFAYIFVTKQKQTATTMLNLGTGNAKTMRYLMYGAMLPSLFASAAGASAGFFMAESVLIRAHAWAAENSMMDLTFSTIRTSLSQESFQNDFSAKLPVIIFTVAVVFLVCCITCMCFANALVLPRKKSVAPKKRRKTSIPKERRTPPAIKSTKNTNAKSIKDNSNKLMRIFRRVVFVFRHGIRSIFRMPGKSVIVPAVSLAIIILISAFCALLQSYTRSIEQTYKNTEISGEFLTLNGTSNDGLLLTGEMLHEFVEDAEIESYEFSNSEIFYKVISYYDDDENLIPLTDENISSDAMHEVIPDTPFVREKFIGAVLDRSKLVLTTSPHAAPEFYGSGMRNIEYEDGYDDSLFMGDEYVCVVSESFFERTGVPKDCRDLRVSCAIKENREYSFYAIDLKIVGITAENTNRIYAPMGLALLFPQLYDYSYYDIKEGHDWLDLGHPELNTDKNEDDTTPELSDYARISAFSFTLRDGYEVAPMKLYLNEKQYSYPSHIGMIRKCLVINDTELQNTVNSLMRVRGYLEVLYPVIYVIVIAIAFVMSYLLIRTRTTDIAIMRSLGSGKSATFVALFTEQFLPSVTGAGLGVLVMKLMYDSITSLQWVSAGLYMLCYALGLVIAVFAINSVDVLKILSSKD
ncbi:MAG: hypothetical protein IJO93_01845 [Clostridia bacterium]|nr:hypothetical protein [Clostridia bacterium]